MQPCNEPPGHLSSEPSADRRSALDGCIPAIYAPGLAPSSTEGSQHTAVAAPVGFKKLHQVDTGRPPPHHLGKPPLAGGQAVHMASSAALQPRLQHEQLRPPPPIALQSSLSRERCKRSGAWLKAFADAAAATAAPAATWEGQEAARVSRTSHRHCASRRPRMSCRLKSGSCILT